MTSFPSASVLGRQSSRLPTGHMPRAPVLPCLQRSTLSAAPIRATTVKRAHESGPVATGAAELGRLFFWILPRSGSAGSVAGSVPGVGEFLMSCVSTRLTGRSRG